MNRRAFLRSFAIGLAAVQLRLRPESAVAPVVFNIADYKQVFLPSITFVSDPDTGFYRTSKNDWKLSVGGHDQNDWLL